MSTGHFPDQTVKSQALDDTGYLGRGLVGEYSAKIRVSESADAELTTGESIFLTGATFISAVPSRCSTLQWCLKKEMSFTAVSIRNTTGGGVARGTGEVVIVRLKLHHPLWLHIPAGLQLVFGAYLIRRAAPLPASIPTHFGLNGRPDRFGSPWEFVFYLAMALLVIGLSVAAAEQWARMETRKTFNWAPLLDEITVGFLVAMLWGQLGAIRSSEHVLNLPWSESVLLIGGGLVLATLLELIRPASTYAQEAAKWETDHSPAADTLREWIRERAGSGRRWAYWESQDPWWMDLIFGVSGLFTLYLGLMAIRAAADTAFGLIIGLFLLVTGAFLLIIIGGIRAQVTPEAVRIKLGLMPLARIPVDVIQSVELKMFAPLKEYGGWGVRTNRAGTWAYFLRGNRGAFITKTNGRTVLIGSDTPDRLVAALEMAKETKK